MTRTRETLEVDKDWVFSRFNEIRKKRSYASTVPKNNQP